MGANELQEPLLETIKYLSSRVVTDSEKTITIKATIVEELDSGTHQYKIKYGAAEYSDVYAISANYYAPDTVVYVSIPDGHFDDTKLILSSVEPNSTENDIEIESDIYIPQGDNLFIDLGDINLKSWVDTDTQIFDSTTIVGRKQLQYFKEKFKEYLQLHRNFLFSALVKTEIDIHHQAAGDYGLTIAIPFVELKPDGTKKEDGIVQYYSMKVDTMEGNPYSFDAWQRINIYYNFDESLVFDDSRDIEFRKFVKDFGYSEEEVTEKEKEIAEKKEDIYDIHFKDISFQALDALTPEQKNGYYLALVANDGQYFLKDNPTSKTLTPILKLKGKNTDIKGYDCYWFVEDASIDTSSNYYYSLGGLGWKCLNQKDTVSINSEGKEVFNYVKHNRTYTVKPEDVENTLKYKCVLCRGDVLVSGVIQLKNLKSNIDIDLISASGDITFIENVGEVRLIAKIKYPGFEPELQKFSYEWQRFDKTGTYIDNNFYTIIRDNELVDGYYETEIAFPCSKIENNNTINCTFYCDTVLYNDKNEQEGIKQSNLGTKTILVSTRTNAIYNLKIEGGDVLYKYDGDGDSPFVSNYDGPISSRLEAIQPINFKLYKIDGKELTDQEYLYCKYCWKFPIKSMMKLDRNKIEISRQDSDYYYIEGTGKGPLINYSILEQFDKNKSNNTIILDIDFDGNKVSGTVTPTFLKDGASGTNGTKFSAYLVNYIDSAHEYAFGERDSFERIRKLQCVFGVTNPTNSTGSWYVYKLDESNKGKGELIPFNDSRAPLQLAVRVYKDGVRIQDPSQYRVTWSLFDSDLNSGISEKKMQSCFSVNNSGRVIAPAGTSHNDRFTKWLPGTVYCTVIRAEIKVTDSSKTDSDEYIYAYYPIEVTRIANDAIKSSSIPSLEGGYSDVLYAGDSTNPKWDNKEFRCIDSLYNKALDKYSYEWFFNNNNFYKSINKDNYAIINPVAKFDNGDSNNYIKVVLKLSAAAREQIKGEIKTKLEEKNSIEAKKANYQNRLYYIIGKIDPTTGEIEITGLINSFNYDNYIALVKQMQKLLNYRLNLIMRTVELYNMIGKIIGDIELDKIDGYTNYNNKPLNFDIVRSQIENAYTMSYRLGMSGRPPFPDRPTLNDIPELDCKINNTNPKTYGDYAEWNEKITDYNNNRDSIQQLTDQYNILRDFYTQISDLSNTNDLQTLISLEDSSDRTDREFTNFKNSLIAISNNMTQIVLVTGVNGVYPMASYDSFTLLLDRIQHYYSRYNNVEYQKNYYDNLMAVQDEKIKAVNQEIKIYEGQLLPENTDQITHIRPIVMTSNRYELSHITNWDGNKLYIDNKNNEYLLAPQVGAGKKNGGLFTGMIMGVKDFSRESADIGTGQQIGLMGYHNGIQSLFLNAVDGSAIFGKYTKGQIVIDPALGKALLYSSNYFEQSDYGKDGKVNNYNKLGKGTKGMLINLSDSYIHLGNAAEGKIYAGDNANWKAGNNGFHLSYEGLRIGSNFVIAADGSAEIMHENSNIGQWRIRKVKVKNEQGAEIETTCIVSNQTSDGVFLDAPHSTVVLGSGQGKIYSGNHYNLKQRAQGFYLSNEGLSIHDFFRVSKEGVEIGKITGDYKEGSSKWWMITGTNDKSYIGYNADQLYMDKKLEPFITKDDPLPYKINDEAKLNSTYIGVDGIRLGKQFAVNNEGVVLGTEMYLEKGQIGAWKFDKNTISTMDKDLFDTRGTSLLIHAKGLIQMKYKEVGLEYIPWELTEKGQVHVGKDLDTSIGGNRSLGSFFGGVYLGDGEKKLPTTYSSSLDKPFKGTCVTHIKTLADGQITASLSSTEEGTIGGALKSVWIALNSKANTSDLNKYALKESIPSGRRDVQTDSQTGALYITI